MSIKSTDSNNKPEELKKYSEGWDRIFGEKVRANTPDSEERETESDLVTRQANAAQLASMYDVRTRGGGSGAKER